MHRRPLGRGRILATIAALAILVGCALPWYTVGGEVEGIEDFGREARAGVFDARSGDAKIVEGHAVEPGCEIAEGRVAPGAHVGQNSRHALKINRVFVNRFAFQQTAVTDFHSHW